jgi:hypothetical protein
MDQNLIDQILPSFEEATVQGFEEFKNISNMQEDVRELIEHFIKTTTVWLGTPTFQHIIQQKLSLATGAPHLIHSILAISAAHLSRIEPSEKSDAAAIHYQCALSTYCARLGTPISSSKDVDEVIACGFLHTMLAFENVSRRSVDKKIQNKCETTVSTTWLRAMQGMTTLQRTQAISFDYTQSIWLPVFLESGGCEDLSFQDVVECDDTWASTTSTLLHSLCKVSSSSSKEYSTGRNPYHQPLKSLCTLMRLEASHHTVGRFIVFIGQLPEGFVQLFEQRDTIAMLIMTYWCSMISGINQWWITDSAVSECRRLCAILDTVLTSEVRELLRFPARKCGYILRA